MPNDYITIKALTKELEGFLNGGKIDKVTMPEKDVSFKVRGNKY